MSSPKHPSRLGALAAVFVTAVLFSTGGAAIKLGDLGAWPIGGLRSAVAAVVLFLALPAVRRPWSREVLLVGLPYAGVMLLFVHANTRTLAVSTTLLQASAPLYVALLSPWLLRELVPRRLLVLLPVFAAGVWLLLSARDRPSAVATDPELGRWLAAGAGICYGLVILGLRRLEDRTGSDGSAGLQAVVCGNVFAALIALPFVVGQWRPPTSTDLMVVGYLGFVQIGLAYVLLVPAMRVLEALDVSLLLLVELVTSPLFAWWLHDEVPGPRTLFGGLLILGACIAQSLWADREARAPAVVSAVSAGESPMEEGKEGRWRDR